MPELTPMETFLFANVMIINVILLFLYHRVLLNIFNKTFNIRKQYEAGLKAAREAEEVKKEREKMRDHLIGNCPKIALNKPLQKLGKSDNIEDNEIV